MMHNEKELKKEKLDVKPKFLIADKAFALRDLPSNLIIEHLEGEINKRNDLAETSLPKDRLKKLLRK